MHAEVERPAGAPALLGLDSGWTARLAPTSTALERKGLLGAQARGASLPSLTTRAEVVCSRNEALASSASPFRHPPAPPISRGRSVHLVRAAPYPP